MENKDRSVLIIGTIASLFGVIISLMYLNNKPNVVITTNICQEDSLQNVINELQIDLKMQSDGFDSKEKRYEEILFEYEYGVNYLKDYQPQAYREFHRIIGHKERYSIDTEQENKKRLSHGNSVDLWR
jgi:hypothetical protein